MKLLLPIFLIITADTLEAQMKNPDDYSAIHDRHKINAITSRRFTQNQMLGWIQPLSQKGAFTTKTIGTSAEGRSILIYTLGNGPVKILFWSQMHGDEPTATMALIDLLSFFSNAPDHPVSQAIRQNLTLLIIPMINPDGAERFQRRTAQFVDMNRDALRLATPEAQLLKTIRDRHEPEFGFNLHDQDHRYTVGQSKDVAAIGLLAPAMDDEKSDNTVRAKAKQVAARITEALQKFVPGHVTRYDDTFEPRAFGDNVQKWGTSTILIESGGWPGDPEKMHLRKANFIALLSAMMSIAKKDYDKADVPLYETLPFNGKNMYDIILRGATFRPSQSVLALTVDVGINVEEERDSTGQIIVMAKIMDLGDLSTMAAYQDIDCAGMVFDSTDIELQKSMPKQAVDDLLNRKRHP
ncbi:MAG: M14 family zinc carboxypeptidase [Bacteroidota bacterium]